MTVLSVCSAEVREGESDTIQTALIESVLQGQLGRLLTTAANDRNIPIAILDRDDSPAKQINATKDNVSGSFSNPEDIRKLARRCDILTVEIEHVDTYVLEQIERESEAEGKKIEIQPSWETIRIIQDKFLQKERLMKNNIKVAQSIPIEVASETELGRAAENLGLPFMLKARTGAYDGKGNFAVKSYSDFSAALESLKGRSLYAERWVNFTKELAVMIVKTEEKSDPTSWKSSTVSYPAVETVHENNICKLVYAPARGISETTNIRAQHLARKAVSTFKGKGVFGVELFWISDGSILLNEIAPRPHNSGHYTIEACRLSQYDAHLLSILDRPVPKAGLQILNPAIMLNILGGPAPKSYLRLADAADAVAAKVHLYGKGNATKGRKMGHLTVVGAIMEEIEEEIKPLITIADEIRDETPPNTERIFHNDANNGFTPLVGVITGSISDQPQLEACYKILTDFGIPFEKGIKSAHRTPDEMAKYAKEASDRGIKVIIAAAGGAAHLAGMTAAFAKVTPVIGLPIKPSIGDGTDSLLSMTSMPRGCPVLVVGINNSTNAALGAARVLAGWDDDLREKCREYTEIAEWESLENDWKLRNEASH